MSAFCHFAVGTRFDDLELSWQAAEEAGFEALWTVDHATPTPALRPAWEASSLLVAMAARTQTIRVGVLVFDVLLRHPFHVAGSVAVAQAMSDGRVRVGLGVGDKFSKLDQDALARPFPPFVERVRFLEACCIALPRLWRGDTVTEPLLGLQSAAFGPMAIDPPPLIVGGGSRSLIGVAARHARGWNLFTQEPETFASRVQVLDTLEATSPRRVPLSRSVYLFVDRVSGDLRTLLADFEAVGAEEAMLVVTNPTRGLILDLAGRIL